MMESTNVVGFLFNTLNLGCLEWTILAFSIKRHIFSKENIVTLRSVKILSIVTAKV